jgi:predicted DCC family thiol-disulfide oxidoreductase YuxK
MTTEITDTTVKTPAGWIFFDAECRFCVASRRRWGRTFERRGFVWVPLQTPGTAARLGVAPDRLMAEMWLLPAGAPPLSGVSAWIGLMRHVWWLRPLALVLELPGIKCLAGGVYRWIARHRHCIGGQCRIPQRQLRHRHRHIAFLELP